jgi:subtilisin family serine protease
MPYNEYVILEIDVARSTLERRLKAQRRPFLRTMGSDLVVESRPRGKPLNEFVKASRTKDEKEFNEARRDPRKLPARIMPLMSIRPIEAWDSPSAASGPAITAPKAMDALMRAQTDGVSWGIPAVLGPSPAQIDCSNVTVAILDTGVNADHLAFSHAKQTILATRKNFTKGVDGDVDGHGTHCAATIFGREVEGVRIGVAPSLTDVRIGKVVGEDGSGDTASLIEALKWAHTEKVRVVSMSLGLDFIRMREDLVQDKYPIELATSIVLRAYRDSIRQLELILRLLAQEAADYPGAVTIAGAGNESQRQHNSQHVIDVGIPAAAAQEVISVGAVWHPTSNSKLDVAPFSNINPRVAAPGVGIVSAALQGGLTALNGTSTACPHVAGVAALWWAFLSNRNGGQVKALDVHSRVLSSARDTEFEPTATYTDRGAGLVQAPAQ